MSILQKYGQSKCKVCDKAAPTLKCAKCKTPYCSVECQTVDWKENGHKKACKLLVKAMAEETPNQDGKTHCPLCATAWDVNRTPVHRLCCCREICQKCEDGMDGRDCPLCKTPAPDGDADILAILQKHADNNQPIAVRQLGDYYAQGTCGLKPSHKKAAKLYERAVDLGDTTAMNNLGAAYMTGKGVKIDKKKAVKYYQMASEKDLALAQYNLGTCFYKGNGVAQDLAEAVRLFKVAAESDVTDAEFNLGGMYNNGEGVAKDANEAKRLWGIAAAKGHLQAKAALKAETGFAHLAASA